MPKPFDFGHLPSGWELRRLSTMTPPDCPIVYGIVQAGPNVEDGVPYLRSTDVGGNIDVQALPRTSHEIAAKYRRAITHPGDLVFSLRGNIGEMSIVPPELPVVNLTQGTARISVDDTVTVDYLRHALSSPSVTVSIASVAKGSTFREISIDQLRKVIIPVPRNIKEQRAIAIVLNTWDRGIQQVGKLITAQLRFKQGLMRQRLSGKMRFKRYTAEWSHRRFGDFLTESRIAGSNGAEARKLTIRLYGKGVCPKSDTRPGSKATQFHRRRVGQFIYSKLDFLNGAFGIIPPSLDGYESTLDLPAFDIDKSM